MGAITMILGLLCGVALFLFGMSLMGSGLQRVAGNSLEKILYRLTSTPIKGVLLGTVVTAVIQSSSATTVMVVGFVNTGMMKVAQAIGVIMGANIGTSITGWILCLSYVDGASGWAKIISTTTIYSVVAIIGIILKQFTKRTKYHNIGEIMLGFAILMVGMTTMSGSMSSLKENAKFVGMLTEFNNPILGILIGIGITAILQSASASVGVLQALAFGTGCLTFATAFPTILGIGVGAAVPVLISGFSSDNKNGRRTALVYLVNDVLGMLIWGIIFYAANGFLKFGFMNMVMTPWMIALLNTVYRLLTIMVLFPFVKAIEKLVFTLIKDTPEDLEEQAEFDLLEERFLTVPELAISQAHKVMNGMARNARKNVNMANDMLFSYDEGIMAKVDKKEDLLDKYEDKLSTYLMQASKAELSGAQSRQVSKFLHTVSDFERFGDHALNIAFISQELHENNISFSQDAMAEIDVIKAAVTEALDLATESFQEDDITKAAKVEPLRQWINKLAEEVKSRHINRLQGGICDVQTGVVFNDLISNYERIAAHASNIAAAVIEASTREFNTHEFLHDFRHTHGKGYHAMYDKYTLEYALAAPTKTKVTAEDLKTEEADKPKKKPAKTAAEKKAIAEKKAADRKKHVEDKIEEAKAKRADKTKK